MPTQPSSNNGQPTSTLRQRKAQRGGAGASDPDLHAASVSFDGRRSMTNTGDGRKSNSARRAPVNLVGANDATGGGAVARESHADQAKGLAKAFVLMVFPPITWVPKYAVKEDFGRDLIGGLVMGVMFVPMGLAYAALIGIPLHIGLYSSAVYTAVYGIFGNVASLSMGPVAEISLLLLGDSTLPDDPVKRATVVQSIAFQVGVLSLGMAIFQGGIIIRNSFAREVGNAYATAAGIILICVQLKDAFNIRAKSTVLLHEAIETLIRGLLEADINTLYSFIFFVVLLAYLLVVKKLPQIPSWIPHQLVVLVVGILLTWGFRLDEKANLSIVKDIPTEFPPVGAPDVSTFGDTIVTSIVITLIAFLQMYSIATRMSSSVRANQELFASGMCAMAAGFLGGIPGSSSFSRCSVLGDLKVKTPLNCFFAGLVVFGCAAGLTRFGVFYYLPKLALSAIIVSSVYKLVSFEHAMWLFRLFKMDFLVWLVVFLLTLFLGVAFGILGGIGLSILVVLFRVSIPKSYPLCFDPLSEEWIDGSADDELLIHREVHVWRFDSPLYFVNVSYVTPQLLDTMNAECRPIQVVVVDCRHIRDVDASSIESFTVQLRNLEKNREITIVLAGMQPKLAAALLQVPSDPFKGETFDTVGAAVKHADHLVMAAKKLLAPHRPVPASLYRHTSAGGFAVDDAVGIVAVVSHADRSPKQKLKLSIPKESPLAEILKINDPKAKERTVVVDAQSSHTKDVIAALEDWPREDPVQRRVAQTLGRLMSALLDGTAPRELRESFRAVAKRVKDKKGKKSNKDEQGAAEENAPAASSSASAQPLQLVAKWGGSITDVGSAQAEACGSSLARRLGLGQDAQRARRGANATTRKIEIGVTTNGEERVLVTGVAFSGAFAEAVQSEGPRDFDVDHSLQRPAPSAKSFEDECLARVSAALHARDQRQILMALDVPGMRTIIQRAERAAWHGHHQCVGGGRFHDELQGSPLCLLWDVAERTAELVEILLAAAEASAREPTAATLDSPIINAHNNDADDDGAKPSKQPLSPLGQTTQCAVLFANEEPADDMARRYSLALSQFLKLQQVGAEGGAGGHDSDGEGGESAAINAAPREVVEYVRKAMQLDHVFDVSKLTALYDNATYDVIHNATRLEKKCDFDLRPLLATLQPLYVAVSAGRFGVAAPARHVAGSLVGLPLLKSMQTSVLRQIEAHRAALDAAVDSAVTAAEGHAGTASPPATAEADAEPFALVVTTPSEKAAGEKEVTQHSPSPPAPKRRVSTLGVRRTTTTTNDEPHTELVVQHDGGRSPSGARTTAAAGAAGSLEPSVVVIPTPETEALPVQLLFTSTGMITALRHVMANCEAMREAANPHAREALSRADTGWHYMAHLVFTVTFRPRAVAATTAAEDPTTPKAGDDAAAVLEADDTANLSDYVVDVYLSTGASLSAEASQRLDRDDEKDEEHDGGDGEVAAPTTTAPLGASAADDTGTKSIVEAEVTVAADAEEAARQARQAARYLTKVSPMLRVWRLTAAEFVGMIDETENLVHKWDRLMFA